MSTSQAFYNTTNETGQTLEHCINQAKGQDKIVLDYFLDNGSEFSPSQVWQGAFSCKVPITSVRRAMSNLVDDGALIKTGVKIEGYYGRMEHVWRLNEATI